MTPQEAKKILEAPNPKVDKLLKKCRKSINWSVERGYNKACLINRYTTCIGGAHIEKAISILKEEGWNVIDGIIIEIDLRNPLK